jgi:pyridoxal 5'-phosphate synthase pdxT subunit
LKIENGDVVVGVLALQGDFAEHIAVLRKLGAENREVRTPTDLTVCDRLILPGGESTTMSTLLTSSGLRQAVLERAADGTFPMYGTCAGAILLASEVSGKNPPDTLELLDITVHRNAYGTQLQSFDADIDIAGVGKVRATFIRAPKITRVGEGMEILAQHDGVPVLVRKGNLLAGIFHTEVRGETGVHRLFLGM